MIHSLRLQNYRSYIDESFEFEGGVNIVVGPNASGKTNLLESVLLLAGYGSYRAKDTDLLHNGSEWSRLDGQFDAQTRVIKLRRNENMVARETTVNDKVIRRRTIETTVPVVLFEPNNLLLLHHGPSYRREYFDSLLEQTVQGFVTTKNYYKRALAQRNSLLKQQHVSHDQLFVWNVRLSELGGAIVRQRLELIEILNDKLPTLYSRIAHQKSSVSISYSDKSAYDSNYSSTLLQIYETTIDKDRLVGFTTHGPHRDDIIVTLNDRPADITASRGETRTLVLAMKIAELQRLEGIRRQKPILLLDDVFSELDGARRRFLVDYLQDTQTIMTTTDADAVINYFTQSHNLIALSK